MAIHRWPSSIDKVLGHEGGYTNDRRDPGNWTGGKVGVGQLKGTYKGISAASFPNLDIKNLSDKTVKEIYKVRYWNPIRGDQLPGGVDYCTFDFGVNSGISRSAKYLQSVVGVSQDGHIGPLTLDAVAKMAPEEIVKRMCRKRLGFLQALSTWATFGRGWSRRVAEVEATGVVWALEDKGMTRPQIESTLEKERDKANSTANSQGGAAVGSGGTGAAGGGATVGPDLDLNTTADIIMALGALALIAVAGYLVVRFVINKNRSKAYAKAASGELANE